MGTYQACQCGTVQGTSPLWGGMDSPGDGWRLLVPMQGAASATPSSAAPHSWEMEDYRALTFAGRDSKQHIWGSLCTLSPVH